MLALRSFPRRFFSYFTLHKRWHALAAPFVLRVIRGEIWFQSIWSDFPLISVNFYPISITRFKRWRSIFRKILHANQLVIFGSACTHKIGNAILLLLAYWLSIGTIEPKPGPRFGLDFLRGESPTARFFGSSRSQILTFWSGERERRAE